MTSYCVGCWSLVQTKNRTFGKKRVDLPALYERDGGRCQICYRKVRIEDVVLDHIIPVSSLYKTNEIGQGRPSDPLLSDPINAQIAHDSCNKSRRDIGHAQMRLL